MVDRQRPATRTDLGRELANLRTAAGWAAASGDLDTGMRLVAAFPQASMSFLLFEIGDWGRDLLDVEGADSHELAPRVALVTFLSGTAPGPPSCV